MKRILITGMSGAGKTSVIEALQWRGYSAVDTDSDGWCEWQAVVAPGNLTEGTPEPDWVWREDRMRELLTQERSGPLFVCGCKSNQGQFYQDFDHVVLLTAPADVLLSRIEARQDNPYGKSDEERERIVSHIQIVEPLLRAGCDVEIDTARLEVGDVADALVRLGQGKSDSCYAVSVTMTAPPPPTRKIVHVDMDAFYASVEARDDARLRGIPLAVAWDGPRGVVLTASYEARAFGVRSAMPAWKARQLCPGLTMVPPRFEAYRAVSREVRSIFLGYTPLVEPLSLDEAYLDVSAPLRGGPSATRIAEAIRAEIRAATGLTATAGVSGNKFLAKLASGMNKPDGLTVILPHQAQALLDNLAVSDFHGVGPATEARLAEHGIRSGADLRAQRREDLVAWFGRMGEHFYHIARGMDARPVEPDRPVGSIGAEETAEHDLRDRAEVCAMLPPLAATVAARLAAAGLCARTVVLKLKYADRTLITRRATLAAPISTAPDLARAATDLLSPDLLGGRWVRLVGITAAGLALPGTEGAQGRLFEG